MAGARSSCWAIPAIPLYWHWLGTRTTLPLATPPADYQCVDGGRLSPDSDGGRLVTAFLREHPRASVMINLHSFRPPAPAPDDPSVRTVTANDERLLLIVGAASTAQVESIAAREGFLGPP